MGGLPPRGGEGAAAAAAAAPSAPAGMGSMGLPPKKEKGKAAAAAAAKEDAAPAGMGSMGLPPKKGKGGKKKAGGASAAAGYNPYANPFNPYAGMGGFGGMGGGDPLGNPYGGMDELEEHMKRMFAGAGDDGNLQETLAALNGQAAGAAGAGGGEGAGGEDAMMKAWMEQMAANQQGMQQMMDTMLQNLLSKETLYEPMVDLSQKYPVWIKKNKKKISDEDVIRYEAQLVKIRAIIQAFDDEEKDFQKIVTLLQEMQAFGMPPDEIMKELQAKNAAKGEPDFNPFAGLPGGAPPPGECAIM